MLYRIFTENKNKKAIEKIVNKYYPSYTLYKAEGFWRLQKENTLIVEIITEDHETKINKIAKEIKQDNKQESVLIQKIKNRQWLI